MKALKSNRSPLVAIAIGMIISTVVIATVREVVIHYRMQSTYYVASETTEDIAGLAFELVKK